MKLNTNFLFFLCIVGLGAAFYFVGKRSSVNDIDRITDSNEIKYDSVVRRSNEIELKNKKRSDSLEAENKALTKYIKLTDKTINKLLQQNEKNKANLNSISDSVRIRIIDSILRANGYRN